MKRILVVEDEPLIRNSIVRIFDNRTDVVVVGSCGSVEAALVMISGTSPDIILLDINLPDGTGFDILDQVEPGSFHVIFITAYNDFAIKAIKYGALDYLLKPLNEEELELAIRKIIEEKTPGIHENQLLVSKQHYREPEKDNRIVLRFQQYFDIVSFEDIAFCKSDGGYTTFFMTDGREIMISKTLKEYEELLPEKFFIRTHRSYLVNKRFIDRYHKEGYLVLRNGKEIPISTRRRDYVMNFLDSFLTV